MNFLRTYKYLILITSIVLFIKCILIFDIPLTEDEFNIALWGKYLSWGGYYEHPPFSGWIVAFMQLFSHSIYWLRLLPALIVPLMAWISFLYLKKYNKQQATAVFYFFMLSPINLVAVLMSPVILIMFMAFLSFFTFYLSEQHRPYTFTLLSSIFLGLAIFTKYTATTLAIAYLVYTIVMIIKMPQKWHIFIIKLGMLAIFPLLFLGINLLWNYTHGWPNLLFNIITRNNQEGTSFLNHMEYLSFFFIFNILFVSPFVILILLRYYHQWLPPWIASIKKTPLFFILFAGQLILFFILSLYTDIGANWLLPTYTLLPFLLGMALPSFLIKKLAIGMGIFSLLCFLIISPLSYALFHTNYLYKDTIKSYLHTNFGIALYKHPNKFKQTIYRIQHSYPKQTTFIAIKDNYGFGAEVAYILNQKVGQFRVGNEHGRTFDRLDNYKPLNHQNIIILLKNQRLSTLKGTAYYQQFFKSIRILESYIGTPHNSFPYILIIGQDFNYPLYRQKVLKIIYEKYYTVPAWLPYTHTFMSKYDFS